MTDILLRPGCSRAVLWEEFLHGTQFRLGLYEPDQLGVSGCERHVKEYMIRRRRSLGLSDAEVDTLHELLRHNL